MPDKTPVLPSFFGRFLTRRHLLIWRSGWVSCILVLALLTAGAAVRTAMLTPSATVGESEPPPAPRILSVVTSPVAQAGPETLTQQFVGIVRPRRQSLLAAKTVGRIEQVLVDIGDVVQAGDLLVELDHAQLDARKTVVHANLAASEAQLAELVQGPRSQDIEQAEALVEELRANLRLAEATHERNRSLRESKTISKQDFEESTYQFDAVQARLLSAEKKLDQLREGTRRERITAQRAVVEGFKAQLKQIEADIADQFVLAPFSGMVQTRAIDEGTVVSPGQSLIEVVEKAPYEIRVGLPPEMAMNLSVSDLAVTNGHRGLTVSIDRIAPAITESTRTREVVLLLSETSSELTNLGSAVSISIRKPVESSGFWLPTKALTGGARGLWIVYLAVPQSPSGHADSLDSLHVIETRQVELLRSQGTWSEVQGPLDAGDVIVVEGVHRITPGQVVRCTKPNPDR